jgi:hypothetical protein
MHVLASVAALHELYDSVHSLDFHEDRNNSIRVTGTWDI